MSNLNDLLAQVAQHDAKLGEELRREVKALEARRAYGLNFERHQPENVELPGRPIRRGDTVHFLPERGQTAKGLDKRLWKVTGIHREGDKRVAELMWPPQPEAGSRKPEAGSRKPEY